MAAIGASFVPDAGVGRPALVWRFDRPRLVASSAAWGGGLGPRAAVVNLEVDLDYGPDDVPADLARRAEHLGLVPADTVALCTAASVERVVEAVDGGVVVWATVGLSHPTWAAEPEGGDRLSAAAAASSLGWTAGTINLVALVPVGLEPGALINAVATATEAKAQALAEAGVPGTGTASDAVCVACPVDGPVERYAGPRAPVGAALARAVHRAVADGAASWLAAAGDAADPDLGGTAR